MLIGILAGLATCALWGLTFIAPRAVEPFTAWDLTVARYGIFGLASGLLMLHRRFRPTGIPRNQIAIGLSLGGLGYVGYFVCAAYAVKWAGGALPPLIIGTMPVIMALIANRREQVAEWRHLVLPLAMIGAGLLIVNLATVAWASETDRDDALLGTIMAVAALSIWVAYGLTNGAVMRSTNAPDALRWTGLQGLGAAIGSVALLPLTSLGEASADLGNFTAWTLIMGLAGSWLATWFWVVSSRNLPLTLAAQLIVAETVFGLLYGFLYEELWPNPSEWIGCTLQIIGVCLGIRVLTLATKQNGRIAPAV
ncbi:Permease of the drug/metabolite transporter (DMT) superfamily [Rhizobium sp. NFR07]|uniref:DMT family transporter n=1 Tax=Rhizobium sp. NFR07 TaxID=1566262 RepID=UPI0008E8C614|nr:DMT family transporter [Rhizobium sp. NFR07]SFB64214.1 Permease of the drug/metabolite transporter (DMT) superfamily [Rhizobium sp. NFR07]